MLKHLRGFITFVEIWSDNLQTSRYLIACLVDNIFVLVLTDRSVFHPSVMLSDNRVSLVPTPKQMNIEKNILFPHSGVNILIAR